MPRILLALVVVLTMMLPIPAKAQDDLQLSAVSVDIWPEYDQQAVLVIYHVTLSADTSIL